MNEQYTVIDRGGQPSATFSSASDAWANADFRNSANFSGAPYTVAKLVPVPRPVPPRPTMQRDRRALYVNEGTLRHPGGTVYHVCDISTMREAIALADATEQWEKEHGGAQG
jgi:hypothetical protein